MAEFTSIATQTIAPGGNAILTETPVCSSRCIMHRDGSGLIRLSGSTNQNRAQYRVSFNANITVPAGGTAGPISVALAVDGEPLLATLAAATPAGVGDLSHVSGDVLIPVFNGCCSTVTVRNTSAVAIEMANLNVIVNRVA